MTLCLKQRFSALTLSLHLLFHRVLDFSRRYYIFKLYTVYLYAPLVGCLVKYRGHFRVYSVTRGKSTVKLKLTYYITKRRSGKVFKRAYRINRSVSVKPRVENPEINNCVYLHSNVIFGYNRLRRRVYHLFFKRYLLCNFFYYRDLYMKSRSPCGFVLAQNFNYIFRCLRNNSDVCKKQNSNDYARDY